VGAFFAGVFFAGVFFAGVFFAGTFFAGVFLAGVDSSTVFATEGCFAGVFDLTEAFTGVLAGFFAGVFAGFLAGDFAGFLAGVLGVTGFFLAGVDFRLSSILFLRSSSFNWDSSLYNETSSPSGLSSEMLTELSSNLPSSLSTARCKIFSIRLFSVDVSLNVFLSWRSNSTDVKIVSKSVLS